jgi:hypothetical protein
VRELVAPTPKAANRVNEVAMLVSAIRRLELAGTVFVRHEEAAPPTEPQRAPMDSPEGKEHG